MREKRTEQISGKRQERETMSAGEKTERRERELGHGVFWCSYS